MSDVIPADVHDMLSPTVYNVMNKNIFSLNI